MDWMDALSFSELYTIYTTRDTPCITQAQAEVEVR